MTAGAAQETRTKTPEQVVDHLLGSSPTTRRQALAWAKDHAAEVVPVLVKALSERPPASLPYDAIRPLGEINDPRLGAALVGLVETPGFPWKPQALEALADQAFPGAMFSFVKGTGSPVSRSRAAACRGLGALGLKKEMDSLVLQRVDDEEAAVRLEAAKTLLKAHDHSGLTHVIKDLSLDRHFIAADPGGEARAAAGKFLKEELGVPADLIPAGVATAQELERVAAFVNTKVGSATEPAAQNVVPHEPDLDSRFRYAIEVRSCLEGDLYLRFDGAGAVVLGRDAYRKFAVDREVTAPITRALDALDTGGKERRILGPVSCDFERLAVLDGGTWRTLVIGSGKSQGGLEGLEKAVVEVLRQTLGEKAADAHVRRTAPFRGDAGTASRAESRAESRR